MPRNRSEQPDQAWFWSKRWQDGEREADGDIQAGRTTVHPSAEAMFAHLSRTPAQ